jgi:formylglycine-generating enzyme required for sulfatase activity
MRAPADWSSPTLGVFKGIPGGTFTMGSPAAESGRDSDEAAHSVTLTRGFWLMEHEVTQGEWETVMGSNPVATGRAYYLEKEQGSCQGAGVGATLPVACVSWSQAVEFALRASARDGVTYRLPTESEWERAARGGGASVYAGSESLDAVGWYEGNSGGKLRPVCGKARNGYGLCDMSGNVREWVQDWYGDYPPGSVTDPAGPSGGSYRVFRGGSWYVSAARARVALRRGVDPASRDNDLGFRLARSNP